MSKFQINELFLYKWRYFIGYGIVSLGLIAVLFFAGMYSPGGTSNAEMQSVVTSSSISFNNIESFTVANLPYHLLQKLSLAVFGVSMISIKLPSLILAFISAIGMTLLLRRWFGRNIGILASLIAITNSQFLFIAQDGTPNILYLLWPVWILLFASLIARQCRLRTFYKFALFITVALSLYTPLSIYVIIALLGAIALHPHLRYLIRQLSQAKLIIGLIIGTVLLVPLFWTIIKTPSLGLALFGIPTEMPNLLDNLSMLGTQYLGFAREGSSTLLTPFFGFGSMLIIAIGAINLVINRSTARSYVIASWIIFLLPVILINPTFISITFLPLVLLLASGIGAILGYWYKLFPRNPYARIGGLIPIIILVIVLVTSGLDRNIYGYRYDPNIASSFSIDLKILPNDVKDIVVSNDELTFYQVIAKYNKNIAVSTEPTSNIFIASRQAKKDFAGYEVDKIITTSSSNQSDRFYLYKKIIK